MVRAVNHLGDIMTALTYDEFKEIRQYKRGDGQNDLEVYGVGVSTRYGKVRELKTILSILQIMSSDNPELLLMIDQVTCDETSGQYVVKLMDSATAENMERICAEVAKFFQENGAGIVLVRGSGFFKEYSTYSGKLDIV